MGEQKTSQGKKKILKDCVTSSLVLPHPVRADAASDWSILGLLGADWLAVCRC